MTHAQKRKNNQIVGVYIKMKNFVTVAPIQSFHAM